MIIMFDFLAITCIANKDAWRCDRTIQISCVLLFFCCKCFIVYIVYVLFADTLEEIQNSRTLHWEKVNVQKLCKIDILWVSYQGLPISAVV